MCATLCALEADSWVGIAGEYATTHADQDHAKALSNAERSLDRALQCKKLVYHFMDQD